MRGTPPLGMHNGGMRTHSSKYLAALLSLFYAFPCADGQDLGEIARQEKQRRSQLVRRAPVLTNTDLSREIILPPVLKERILAQDESPVEAVPETKAEVEIGSAVPDPVGRAPLGEYARQLRTKREEGRTLNAGKSGPDSTSDQPMVIAIPPISGTIGKQPIAKTTRVHHETLPPPNSRKSHSAERTRPTRPGRDENGKLPPQQPMVIQVRRGDSLWQLAQRYLSKPPY
jgi:hypothetical protein